MAEENVRCAYRNFCFGSLNGSFHTIDATNSIARLLFKSSDGALIGNSYTLSPSFAQGTQIDTLIYAGPRYLNATQIQDGLPFYTLYNGIISEWHLSRTTGDLLLYNSSDDFSDNNYTSMSVEYYFNSFAYNTTSGTGYIQVTTSGIIDVDDILLLGPSTDNDSLNHYEYVFVVAASGTNIYVQTLGGGTATVNEYLSGDKITLLRSLYLFSSDGYLDKRSIRDFSLIDSKYNVLYSDVTASSWHSAYRAIALIKSEGSNMFYVDPYDDYTLIKSHTLTTSKTDKVSKWSVLALDFDDLSIYRLQDGKTLSDDTGAFIDYTWSTYNYHQDTISVYTKSITTKTNFTAVLTNDYDVVTLKAIVRDQYGIGLNSKLVYFAKVSGDTGGYFTPLNGQSYTNASGIAEITYTTGYYAPTSTDEDSEEIIISVKTDGASNLTGSQYVWDKLYLKICKRFDGSLYIDTIPSGISNIVYLDQPASSIDSSLYIDCLSKFSNPGGHWTSTSVPSSTFAIMDQLTSFDDSFYLAQIQSTYSGIIPVNQLSTISDEVTCSQTYVSRHVTTGHIATTTIDQFQFVEDAIPVFWSEKNSIGTDIWIRLRPYAFSLNQTSVVFKVKEISYEGDTGWIDVSNQCVITTFDAGGGLLGLDILYNPVDDFHYGSIVYVSISVYDNAPIPNIILTDYWFRVVPDFKAPYITNESPNREEESVDVNSNISFDIIDVGAGVDIDTMELYINNKRIYDITSSGISGGYHIEYLNIDGFYYGQTIELAIKAYDISDYTNVLYDTWRFYTSGSTGPWIDIDSFRPRNCSYGIPRKWAGISVNIYGVDDTGVAPNSIIVHIGGSERTVSIIPIILRIQ